jgi:heme-degrading monooxygenase HmoA
MKALSSFRTKSAAGCLLAVLSLTWSLTVTAGPVIRYVHFTASGAREQQTAMKLVDTEINKAYVGAKGFKWIKYLIDEKTLETGSVSLWDSREDLEAFLKSDAYKGVPDKLKPFMKGTMSSVVFNIYEPKK